MSLFVCVIVAKRGPGEKYYGGNECKPTKPRYPQTALFGLICLLLCSQIWRWILCPLYHVVVIELFDCFCISFYFQSVKGCCLTPVFPVLYYVQWRGTGLNIVLLFHKSVFFVKQILFRKCFNRSGRNCHKGSFYTLLSVFVFQACSWDQNEGHVWNGVCSNPWI